MIFRQIFEIAILLKIIKDFYKVKNKSSFGDKKPTKWLNRDSNLE